MALLARIVSLHDIADIDRYISGVVRKLRLSLFAEERSELECEGLAILYQLAADWDGRGTFSGYVSSLIDLRLQSAWCKLSGCSRQRVYASDGTWTGERRWVKPTVSLDAEMERAAFAETGLRRMSEFQRVPVAA